LKKAGGIAELVTIPGGKHGNYEHDQVLRAWTAIEAFLAKNVLSKAATTSAAR
jgi:dipeptidyl aminopeptidase/acylaminoacyl peptidase